MMSMNLIKANPNLKIPTSEHSMPLISKIDYDKKLENVMQFVFGKIAIVRNMNYFRPPPTYGSTNWKSESGVIQVTIDGQQASGRGVLTGGFFKVKPLYTVDPLLNKSIIY